MMMMTVPLEEVVLHGMVVLAKSKDGKQWKKSIIVVSG